MDPHGSGPLGAADDGAGGVCRSDVRGAVGQLVVEEERGAALRLQADVALGARRHPREAIGERRVDPSALQPQRCRCRWVGGGACMGGKGTAVVREAQIRGCGELRLRRCGEVSGGV